MVLEPRRRIVSTNEERREVERSRRTRILVEGASELRRSLSLRVAERRVVTIVDDPRSALVMVKARETAKNGLFFIGELLVTEAKVQIEGRIGIGIIAGEAAEASLDLAIIDAAFNAGLDEVEGWDSLLADEERRIQAREGAEAALVARTKVVFESMDRG